MHWTDEFKDMSMDELARDACEPTRTILCVELRNDPEYQAAVKSALQRALEKYDAFVGPHEDGRSHCDVNELSVDTITVYPDLVYT